MIIIIIQKHTQELELIIYVYLIEMMQQIKLPLGIGKSMIDALVNFIIEIFLCLFSLRKLPLLITNKLSHEWKEIK